MASVLLQDDGRALTFHVYWLSRLSVTVRKLGVAVPPLGSDAHDVFRPTV